MSLASKREDELAPRATTRRLAARLLCVAAAIGLMVLNGCASAYDRGGAEVWEYNPATGYPAVGGPDWLL